MPPLSATLSSLGFDRRDRRKVVEVEVVHGQVAHGNGATIHDVPRPGVASPAPCRPHLCLEAGPRGSHPRGNLWVVGHVSCSGEQHG